MNIIDAHKIIYDYIDTVSNKKGKFFRFESLQNSVDEIENAWKLYFAHIMIFKNWESPEWLNTFESLISMLPYFYFDFFIDDYDKTESELNKYQNSVFSVFCKSKVKKAKDMLSFCNKCMTDYSLRFIQERGEDGIYTGLKDSYRQAVLDIADKYDASQFDLKTYSGIYQYFDHVADICTLVYQAADIPLQQGNIEVFLPFPLLPTVLKHFNLDKDRNEIITGYYKDYIVTNLRR